MARAGKTANRALIRQGMASVHHAARERAHQIAKDIVLEIATNPHTPDSRAPNPKRKPDPRRKPRPHVHLRDSYYVTTDTNGDALVKCRNPYWVFVEFGTGHGPKQQHVRPAIDVIRALRR